MCRETMSVSANGTGKRSAVRLMTLAACVLFTAAMFLSSFYILTHADHTHDHDGLGGGCATCIRIQAAESLLKQLSTAVVTVAVIFGGLFGIFFSLKTCASLSGFLTLVTLKIRLNN